MGLTGGIATGKSTVAKHLRARGVAVLDADRVSRDLMQPGLPLHDAVAGAFPSALASDGSVDRVALRALIARDPSARSRLDSLTHPEIRKHIAQWLADRTLEGASMAVVEAALLVETGSHRLYQELIVVTCTPEQQLVRLLGRDGGDEAVARGLVAAQLPLATKEAVATALFRNDGDQDALLRQVDAWLGPTRSPP